MRSSSVNLSLLLLGVVACTGGCEPKPRVYRIGGAPTGTNTYNVLFLGAGFQSDAELESYRTAAETLSDQLLKTLPPYSAFPGNLSFWRIDTRSGSIDTSKCSSTPCGHQKLAAPPATMASTPSEILNPTGDAVVKQELGVSLCYSETATGGPCRLLWANADGQAAAAELATYGPNIDAIIILANTQATAGAGAQLAFSGAQTLVVIGVPSDTVKAVNLIGHELGHALGLADEYCDSTGITTTSAKSYSNVWQPSSGCYEPEVTGSKDTPPIGETLDVPWFDQLECKTDTVDITLDCDSNSKTDDTVCPRVWRPCHDLLACQPGRCPGINSDCERYVGLYEGAYYASTGIYRPANDCKMRTLDSDFCPVCDALIKKFFNCNFVSPGTCPP